MLDKFRPRFFVSPHPRLDTVLALLEYLILAALLVVVVVLAMKFSQWIFDDPLPPPG
jgi:hypothetical protein